MVFDNLSVLVIDDSRFMRTIVKQMLVDFGASDIYEAADGMSGLEMVSKIFVDLILCDLSMEPIDGFEFVRFLRNHQSRALQEIPVIILTVHGEQEFVTKANEERIDGYLLKPISRELLRSRIVAVMEQPTVDAM